MEERTKKEKIKKNFKMFGFSTGTPIIDMSGSNQKLVIRKFSGGIKIIPNKKELRNKKLKRILNGNDKRNNKL